MSASDRDAAILKRLREMLVRQRDRFASYLSILEREEDAIRAGDADRLASYVELEQSVVAEIGVLRKVIDPLEDLYQASISASSAPAAGDDGVDELKATLERMAREVLERNARNRALLREKVDELRMEIASLRRWPTARGPMAGAPPVATLVDITT